MEGKQKGPTGLWEGQIDSLPGRHDCVCCTNEPGRSGKASDLSEVLEGRWSLPKEDPRLSLDQEIMLEKKQTTEEGVRKIIRILFTEGGNVLKDGHK